MSTPNYFELFTELVASHNQFIRAQAEFDSVTRPLHSMANVRRLGLGHPVAVFYVASRERFAAARAALQRGVHEPSNPEKAE